MYGSSTVIPILRNPPEKEKLLLSIRTEIVLVDFAHVIARL